MKELIVAGFDDGHTAFLARATLARMQKDLAIEGHDVAVVSLEEGNGVTVREAVDLTSGEDLPEAFWKMVAGLLFRRSSDDGSGSRDGAQSKLSAVGLDRRFVAGLAKAVRQGTSALLVVVSATSRDRVIGILRGFSAHVARIRLVGDDRNQWLEQLAGSRVEQ
jgi:uncharacterized membrane protein